MNTPSVHTPPPTLPYYVGYHMVDIAGVTALLATLVAMKVRRGIKKKPTTHTSSPSQSQHQSQGESVGKNLKDFCLANNRFRNLPDGEPYTQSLRDAGDEILRGDDRMRVLQAYLLDDTLPVQDRAEYFFEMKELKSRMREVGNTINSMLIVLGLPPMEDLGGEEEEDELDIDSLLKAYQEMWSGNKPELE